MFNVGKLITQRFVAGMGTEVIAGNFIAFSIVGLINLPGNSLGSAATIIVGTRLGKGQIMQSTRQLNYIFWLSNIGSCLLALFSIPSAGFLASFYTDEPEVIGVVKHLIWLNALFTPIWAASWVLPAGLKGAKDASYSMWVAMAGMWGCRVIAGYILGVILGFGVIGVWMGMCFDWVVRGVLLPPDGERTLAVALPSSRDAMTISAFRRLSASAGGVRPLFLFARRYLPLRHSAVLTARSGWR